MKLFFVQLFLLVNFQYVFNSNNAQDIPCYANCYNLVTRNIAIDTTARLSYGKTSPANYYDVEYPGSGKCGVNSTDTVCLTNAADELVYQAYFPANNVYSKAAYDSCPLAVMIIFHPGAYSDCSGAFGNNAYDTANALMPLYCMQFAKKGMVCINVEYRRGNAPAPGIYSSGQQILAFYRAIQDGRGFLRTLIQNQRNATSNSDYQIDTNNIFIGGASAGAAIALNLGYYPTQGMEDAIFPGVKARLSSINQDYYVGDTTIEYFSKIRGVMDLWGNGLLPLSAGSDPISFFADNGHFPAIICFHGFIDETAPVDSQLVYFSPSTSPQTIYHSENHCLTNGGKYTVPGSDASPDLISFGSQMIYNFLNGQVPIEFYLDCNAGHGLDTASCTATPGCYDTDYGTGYTDQYQVTRYIVQRTSTFFQAVIKNIAHSLDKNKFVNCQNYRYGCDTMDNYATVNCLTNCTQ